MSATDFPKAVARVSEGFCPLCDERLDKADITVAERAPHDPLYTLTWCRRDQVSWGVERVDGRPLLTHSRQLTPDEIKRLHDRSRSSDEEGSST